MLPEKKKKIFTLILKGSKIFVVVVFLYVSFIMYKLGARYEGITILFATALFLILNKLEAMSEE